MPALAEVHRPMTTLNRAPAAAGRRGKCGLHWRTVKRADTTTGAYNGLDELRVMYYDAGWRMVEEWIDEGYISSSGWDAVAEQYWGLRYIDDVVLRRIDDDLDDTFRQFMQFTDSQFSFIGSIAFNGVVTDRVTYDAYGTARHHRGWDADGDGDIDAADRTLINGLAGISIGHASYKVEADLDRSGTIDATDEGLASGTFAAMPAGWTSVGNGCDSPVGYCGYVFNPETNLYTVRFRNYDTVLGRWLERDPAGYVDGYALFQYVRSGATGRSDPYGLEDFTERDSVDKDKDDDLTLWTHYMCSFDARSLDEVAVYVAQHPGDSLNRLSAHSGWAGESGWAFADGQQLDKALLEELLAYLNGTKSCSDSDVARYEKYLYMLHLIFDNTADEVQFWACSVGAGDDGLRFLQMFRELGLLRPGQTVSAFADYVGDWNFFWGYGRGYGVPDKVAVTCDASSDPAVCGTDGGVGEADKDGKTKKGSLKTGQDCQCDGKPEQ